MLLSNAASRIEVYSSTINSCVFPSNYTNTYNEEGGKRGHKQGHQPRLKFPFRNDPLPSQLLCGLEVVCLVSPLALQVAE